MEPLSEPRLTAEHDEWLLRALTGSRQGVLPFAAVAALVAAGLGEKNARGTFDVNQVGRRYLEAKGLHAIREVPRRNRA